MKDYTGEHFFSCYASYISGIGSKLKNALSGDYIELFNKDYSCYGPEQYNPHEDPRITIERTLRRIERAWKAVKDRIEEYGKIPELERFQGHPVVPEATPTPTRRISKTQAKVLADLGLPANREALRNYAISIDKIREISNKVPAEFGYYKPRDGTALKNATAQLIALIKQVAPSF